MRWLAKSEPRGDKMEDWFKNVAKSIGDGVGQSFSSKDLQILMEYGDYRWLIVHQRGYYLTDPNQGDVLYRDVVRNERRYWA